MSIVFIFWIILVELEFFYFIIDFLQPAIVSTYLLIYTTQLSEAVWKVCNIWMIL